MLTSQLEILEQGRSYLKSITPEEYAEILSPNFISSAGSHIRHIIDHYQAIFSGLETGVIDYDQRLRGNRVETCPALALDRFDHIATQIKALTEHELARTIKLSTEINTNTKKVQIVQTSVARELIFAASHAVHHYAMIAQISYAQNANTMTDFGIAPATATFLRESQCKSRNV